MLVHSVLMAHLVQREKVDDLYKERKEMKEMWVNPVNQDFLSLSVPQRTISLRAPRVTKAPRDCVGPRVNQALDWKGCLAKRAFWDMLVLVVDMALQATRELQDLRAPLVHLDSRA